MDPKYGEKYSELYARHWWWRARQIAILETLRELQPTSGWGEILDVGCGDGLFFDRLLEFGNVDGVEPDDSLVRQDGPHRARIHVAPFGPSFLPGKQYSLILMLDVLEHLSDPIAALRYAQSLLAPAGIVLCTVPAFRLLWTNHDVLNQHITRYTKESFRSLTRLAGLQTLFERYLFQWVFPAKLAVRLVERLSHRKRSVPVVPPAWINKFLFHLTRTEYVLLRRFSVPFGSSLLVVARKSAFAPTYNAQASRFI